MKVIATVCVLLIYSLTLDCRTQEQECTCPVLSADCRCGLNGRCLSDGTCHAAECATLGLRECHCIKKAKSQLSRGLYQGSLLGEVNMCGICCEVPIRGGRKQCVSAEAAAREKLASNSPLPDHWPDEDYIGPNVTVRLCEGYVCNVTTLRAWPPGSVCVSQNVVGVCSQGGLCKLDYITPRSNVYPDTMNIHMRGLKKASRSIKPASIIFISCLVLLCLIK